MVKNLRVFYLASIGDVENFNLPDFISKEELAKFIIDNYPYNSFLIVCIYEMEKKVAIYQQKKTKLVFPSSTYQLPLLYKVDKKKKERVWKIWVDGPTVYKTFGETDGEKVPSQRTFEGVNVGKKNATTAEEQAKRAAERKWVKQLDKGYLPQCKEGKAWVKKILAEKQAQGNVNVGVSSVIRGGKQTKLDLSKCDSGTKTAVRGVVTDEKPPVLPMHCQTWSLEKKVLAYFHLSQGVSIGDDPSERGEGDFIQPKVDGIRAIVKIIDGRAVFFTRSGKQLVHLNHLRDQVVEFLAENPATILDCEVYAPEVYGEAIIKTSKAGKTSITYKKGDKLLPRKQRFEVITGAVRPVRGTPHPLEEQMCLYVFDIADTILPQYKRFALLKKLFTRNGDATPNIRRVPTKTIHTVEEIDVLHDAFVEQSYEGVVIRARDLMYESDCRSLKMRKYKKFITDEFEITGAKVDPGVGKENFTWICTTKVKGAIVTFYPKPEGSAEQKLVWYANRKDYYGKMLTVRYQEPSSNGIPRFPVGVAIRDYE